jgi:hypothetical protein
MVSQRRRSAQALLTRLTFYSGCSVTFLLSLLVTNHSLLIIRFCRAKTVNSTRVYAETKSAPRASKQDPPIKIFSISQGRFSAPVPRNLIRLPLTLVPHIRRRPEPL